MTIPGRGDLAPRRKRRNWPRRLAAGVAVLALAGGGYAAYRQLSGSPAPAAAPRIICASPTPSRAVVRQARLAVRNATLQTGLAARVAHELRNRHFRIGSIGNTLFRGKGVATVKYSADRLQAARLVAAQFAGATTAEVLGSGVLEVDIGPRFRGLVSRAQSQSAERAILASSTPHAAVSRAHRCAIG